MADGIEPAAWRVLAVFRALALVYAVALYGAEQDGYRHRTSAWLLLALMAAWSLAVTLAYRRGRRPSWRWVGPDLAVAVAAILASRVLDSPAHIASGSPTLPVVWSAAPVLAFAIRGGWAAGLGAAVAVGVADVLHRQGLSATTLTNVVLLVVGGALVGYVVPVARRGEVALAQAEAAQAATRERERLSRDIHDGVLQVLALIHRRGAALGGPAAELASSGRPSRSTPCGPSSPATRDRLAGRHWSTCSVSLPPSNGKASRCRPPAGPVDLPAATAGALAAATGRGAAATCAGTPARRRGPGSSSTTTALRSWW